MGVKNLQKTIKKIWDNRENPKGFEHHKPHFTYEFEDGMKAKLATSQVGFAEIRAKTQEGGSYLFTIEDGVYEGKNWYKVCDVLAQGGMPATPATPPQAPKPQKQVDATMPLSGPTMGMILNNATNIVTALINVKAFEPTTEATHQLIEEYSEYFEKKARQQTFIF